MKRVRNFATVWKDADSHLQIFIIIKFFTVSFFIYFFFSSFDIFLYFEENLHLLLFYTKFLQLGMQNEKICFNKIRWISISAQKSHSHLDISKLLENPLTVQRDLCSNQQEIVNIITSWIVRDTRTPITKKAFTRNKNHFQYILESLFSKFFLIKRLLSLRIWITKRLATSVTCVNTHQHQIEEKN